MFDVGFWELCLVGLVSLLVIGPDKLPTAARVAGFWVGKARGMVSSVKAEIKDELQAEEMRQILKQQVDTEDYHKLLDESSELVNDMTTSIKSITERANKKANDSK